MTGYIKISMCFLLAAMLFWAAALNVQAASGDALDEFDFSLVQEQLEETTYEFTFKELVAQLVSGDISGAMKKVVMAFGSHLFAEVEANRRVLVQLILVAIMAAVFTNFSSTFVNNFVGESGFFVTYLLTFSILAGSYMMMANIARDAVSSVLTFMKTLIPCYTLAVTISAGMTTSVALYEGLMIAITIANWIVLKIVLPLINVYLLLELVNNMDKEDRFSKLTSLIKQIINWLLKSVFACIIGFHVIQSLLLPAIDSVKNTAFQKGIQVLPGAGKIAGAVVSTLIGSSVVIKNSIGIAGLIIIIFLISVPVLKLLVFVLGYKLTAALLQPISDKRLITCINSTSESAKVLLDSVLSVAALFMVSIALIAATTNMNYFAG